MKVVAEFFTFPISCVYLWPIQYPYFLHSNDLDLLLQDSDSIYLLLQRKCTPERRNTKIICGLLKSQAISWWIDFNSFFPLYSDQRVCNLHSHSQYLRHEWHITQRHRMFQPRSTRTISLDNFVTNYFRPLLIFYMTSAVRILNILATSLPLPCYTQLYTSILSNPTVIKRLS